jgi:hypothetical protein
MAASSPEKKVTENRNILKPSESGLTDRTVGSREDDRLFRFRQPEDDDIEKAADDGAEDRGENENQRINVHRGLQSFPGVR